MEAILKFNQKMQSIAKLPIFIFIALLTACGGGGGGSSSNTVTQQVTTPAIDPCAVSAVTPTYPNSYNGAFTIPSPTTRFPNSIVRMIDLKDYYPASLPTNSTCTDRTLIARNRFTLELDRLKALGTEVVWIVNYGPWNDINQVPWQFDKARFQIPESEMTYFVTQAKSKGLKVYLGWQMWVTDIVGNSYPYGANLTATQMTNVMLAHRNIMNYLATYANTTGIDGLAVDWQAFNPSNLSDPTIKEIYISNLSTTIDQIKSSFTGKTVIGFNGVVFPDLRLISKVDMARISLGANVTSLQNQTLDVPTVKRAFLQSITQSYAQTGDLTQLNPSIKIEFQFAIQSRDKYFVDGWVEDGFCVTGPANEPCIQTTYTTDFSVQTIGTEAAFQATLAQNLYSVGAVTTGVYWHTDSIIPGEDATQLDFPNLSASIRNKPAENIVKYWYSKN
jgi:hypothetical protein